MEKQGTRAHLGHELALLRRLKAQRYDLVVNLADQWRSAIITRLTGARIRLGFDFPKRRGFLWRHCHTQLVPVDNHAHLHTVEQNLSLLAPLNLPALSDHVTMSYDPQDWQACEQRLQKQGVAGSYIVVQPTSRWFFKCWSEEKMAATLTALQADGHQLVITSGPDAREQAMVERILALCPPQGVIVGRPADAAPAGRPDRPRQAVYRRGFGADAHGRRAANAVCGAVRPFQADFLAAMAGYRRRDLGRRLRRTARSGRH